MKVTEFVNMKKLFPGSISLLIVLMLFRLNVNAQDKFEKERRISREDVPAGALSFLDSLNLPNKVKWYLEEGLTRKTYEAKFKRNKIRHSIEFDTLGHIEDIEIETKWHNLDPEFRRSVSGQLEERCIKHRIVKVQKQFLGDKAELLLLMMDDRRRSQVEIHYELIVRCSQQHSVDHYEYFFNDQGNLLSVAKIIFRNSSHLEY